MGSGRAGPERLGKRRQPVHAEEERALLLRPLAPDGREGKAMTDADLFRLWYLWLAIGGAIVVVAAALLVTIWLTARGIESQARRALVAVERIRTSTQPIWK